MAFSQNDLTNYKKYLLSNCNTKINRQGCQQQPSQASSNLHLLNPIAIGVGAGQYNQSTNSIAIGTNAGQYSLSQESIAIGHNSGGINMIYLEILI